MPIRKILIANRGEIACRIIHTCRNMGIKTVAVYSEADRYAKHVTMADEAYLLGASEPTESYLNIDKIIQVAQSAQVDAVHPGYGFLSERTAFAQAITEQGLIFIGAPIAALELMGSKSAAKISMESAGVPCVPGYHGENQDEAFLHQQAQNIGYPVLIKAVAGGGGKGMKIVESDDFFLDALQSAKREAKKAFGDDEVILEKYILNPRHIEVQVFADSQGHVVHLFERDCSTQRRYQKIIEEAPASYLVDDVRSELLNTAVNATQAIDYVGAGTIEFILDENDKFYFMEMNTRLQVEHRVSEMITGIDLVSWQIKVAQGEPLPMTQMAIQSKGHAIEVRVYAEDPNNNFLPATGNIQAIYFPQRQNVVIDSAVQQGDKVSIYYDPMIAKVIVWGKNRENCIARLKDVLRESYIFGVKTNMSFLSSIINTDAFLDNTIYTNSLDNKSLELSQALPDAVFAIHFDDITSTDKNNLWQRGDNWRSNLDSAAQIELIYQDQNYNKTLNKLNDSYRVDDSAYYQVDVLDAIHRYAKSMQVIHNDLRYELQLPDSELTAGSGSNSNQLLSPMPGKIISVLVNNGEDVKTGQRLLVMEAMKMELSLKAEKDATISAIHVEQDQQITADQLLLEFEAEA